MAIYQVGCPHCKVTTMHSADSSAAAEEQHTSTGDHAKMQKAMNVATGKKPEFDHGKEHNA